MEEKEWAGTGGPTSRKCESERTELILTPF
jgi:hypothetical protein